MGQLPVIPGELLASRRWAVRDPKSYAESSEGEQGATALPHQQPGPVSLQEGLCSLGL